MDAAQQQLIPEMLFKTAMQAQQAAMLSVVEPVGTSLCSSSMPEKVANFSMTCALNQKLWRGPTEKGR